jgi:hypothetical protein
LAALAATVADERRPRPEDLGLRALADETADRLRLLDQRLGDIFDSRRWVTSHARQGRQVLYRVCAAQLVLGHYDSRSPGPLWTGHQDHGWDAAHAVVMAANPNAELERGAELDVAVQALGIGVAVQALGSGRPPPDDYLEQLVAAQCRDLLSPLEEALLHHGQESWTYHRLWDLTETGSASPWTDAFEYWANGATFGGWGRLTTYHRARLLWPELLAALLPALTAAEAAWMAFLDGVAMGAQQPTLCVLRPPAAAHVHSFAGWWLSEALAVAHPSAATTRATLKADLDPRRLLVVVVPEVAALAAADAAWPPIVVQPLDGEVESFPDLCVAVATEIGRLPATAADEELAAVVDRTLADA